MSSMLQLSLCQQLPVSQRSVACTSSVTKKYAVQLVA